MKILTRLQCSHILVLYPILFLDEIDSESINEMAGWYAWSPTSVAVPSARTPAYIPQKKHVCFNPFTGFSAPHFGSVSFALYSTIGQHIQ